MNFLLVACVLFASAFVVAWVVGLSISRVLPRTDGGRTSGTSAFTSGILPLAIACATVLFLVAPAVLLYEPRDTREVPGMVLVAVAVLGVAVVVRTGWRMSRMIAATRTATRTWRETAEPVPGIDQLRAFAVDAEGAAAAVAGFTRPVLFIDRRILAVCSPEEVRAIAAHEVAHVRSGDNFKRLLLAATRGANHPLVSWWRNAAERDADRVAASDARRAVALASALVKVARETQGSQLDFLAVSTVHDGGTIEQRVRALLADVPSPPARRRWRTALMILTALSVTPVAWKPLHAALEVILHALP